MPGKKAVVTLYPVGPVNPTTPRTLTFRSDADCVEIGRASKRESKNLLPQPNNALFDSRVMSRNHAKMWASMDRKLIYIRDNDSMHGTWMDGSKLPVDEKVVISNGAIIAFGVEVVRGRDTFPPLEVRCEYDWIESRFGISPSASARTTVSNADSSDKSSQRDHSESLQPTNTFCVPDGEDDDDIQVLGDPIIEDSPNSDDSNSSSDSDSEDMSVMEIPSPFTSPPKCDQHELTGTQHSPIEVDSEHEDEQQAQQEQQPLATPRMTPTPAARVESHNQTEEVNNVTHETDEPAAPPSPNEEQSPKDLNDWEADQDEESDDVSDEQSVCYSEESSSVSSGPEPDSQYIESAHIETSRPSFEFPGSVLPTTTTTMHTPSVPLPSPSDLLKLCHDPFIPMTGGWSTRSTLNDPHTPLAPLASKCGDVRPPYTDGPFCTMQVPRFVPPDALTSSNEKVSANGSVDADKPALPAEQVQWPPRSNEPFRASESIPALYHSIRSASLKRKADAMEDLMCTLPAMDGFSVPLGGTLSGESAATQSQPAADDHEETCLPDAQPQPTVESLIRSGSSFSDLAPASQATQSEQPVEVSERPAKRLKTSEPSTLRAHATGAVVGAVIGAVGTIALLASLPQDYFL